MTKLLGLQYLRGLAAVAVVIFHAADKAGQDFSVGKAGVDLFFVLSGFLMIAITGDDSRPFKFLGDRIRRIVPVYWIATSVMLAGACAGLFPSVRLTAWHIISSYFFIPSVSPSNGKIWPLLVPGWTLNYEMMFYVVFAALMFLRSQRLQLALLTMLFACLTLAGTLLRPIDAIPITYSDPMLLEFAAGGWIGYLWKGDRKWHSWIGWPTLTIATFMLVAIPFQNIMLPRIIAFGIPSLMILASILAMERKRPIPRLPFPLLIGDASYSIYLWHTLAISVAAKIGEKLYLPTGAIVVLGVTSGVLVGIIGFKLIEEPILKFFHRRRPANRVRVPVGP